MKKLSRYTIVVTNILYLLAGLLSHNEYVALCGLVLLLGSGWMHIAKNDRSTKADWFGMYAFTLSIFAYLLDGGVPLYSYIIGLTIASWIYMHQLKEDTTIGIAVLLLVGIKLTINPIFAVASLVIFVSAFGVRWIGHNRYGNGTIEQNFYHSGWHILAASAYTLLII